MTYTVAFGEIHIMKQFLRYMIRKNEVIES